MLVGLRIISILYDLFLASILFYRPFSKINMKKKPLCTDPKKLDK